MSSICRSLWKIVSVCCGVFALHFYPSTAFAQLNAGSKDAVEVFASVCLKSPPRFPDDGTAFQAYGYDTSTEAPEMYAKAGSGFAGLGFAGLEGGATASETPNGCMVYAKGLDAEGLAATLDPLVKEKFNQFKKQKIENDHYWMVGDYAPLSYVVLVSEKPVGPYAGHTLIMATQPLLRKSNVPKAAPRYPGNPQDKTMLLDAVQKMSPSERIAWFASMHFARCILEAPNFKDIQFEMAIGVERQKSHQAGTENFVELDTGSAMITSEHYCLVAYKGDNIRSAAQNIEQYITLRGSNVRSRKVGNSYVVDLDFENKPYTIQILHQVIQGQSYVRYSINARGS